MSLQDAVDVLNDQASGRCQEKTFKAIAGGLSVRAASQSIRSPDLMDAVIGLRILATRGNFDLDSQGRERMAHLADVVEAINWRRENGYIGQGGIVVFYNRTSRGWVDELRDSAHWQPGSLAVNEAGDTWIAVRVKKDCGVSTWKPLWVKGQHVR
jgi:hypothetical protein